VTVRVELEIEESEASGRDGKEKGELTFKPCSLRKSRSQMGFSASHPTR